MADGTRRSFDRHSDPAPLPSFDAGVGLLECGRKDPVAGLRAGLQFEAGGQRQARRPMDSQSMSSPPRNPWIILFASNVSLSMIHRQQVDVHC